MIQIFKKKSKITKDLTRVQKRVKTLPTSELLMWTDQIIYSTGRSLSAWQKSQHPASLGEARLGAESLFAIIDELSERNPS